MLIYDLSDNSSLTKVVTLIAVLQGTLILVKTYL